MQLPDSLQVAIEKMSESFGVHELKKAREELSQRYRGSSSEQLMKTEAHRHAYIISRLPATYAALQQVFKAIRERADLPIKSVLDLGAGPGTGVWAACDHFPEIEQAILVERDVSLIAMGRQFAELSEHRAIRGAQWKESDLEKLVDLPLSDLVILSYSIGELKPESMISLMNLCWKSAKQICVVVEPGTPVGFERIRLIRRKLIDWGAHLIAPCPHHLDCPMAGGDWCHFSARVERSSLHRRLKEGSLGHEDEKFSYVAATKKSFLLPPSRILRQPLRHSGHVVLKLCTTEGVQQPTISKKMGDLYKQARKAEWGDPFFY